MKIVRVENKEGIGIKDFASISEVPKTILDWRSDTNMTIETDNLQVYYSSVK